MSERALRVLKLFSFERPIWTAEEVAAACQVSVSSAYRFIAILEEAGLLAMAQPKHYVLGPAIIQYDRQIQLTDPLLIAARPVMKDLIGLAPDETTLLLCRAFGHAVLCVYLEHAPGPQPDLSYQRGRPMPLFRGATSKIILAYSAPRSLKRIYEQNAEAIRGSGLGDDWLAFKGALAQIRRTGFTVSRNEVDTGAVGVAVPILTPDRVAVGSLSYVIPEPLADERLVGRLSAFAQAGARQIEAAIADARPDAVKDPGPRRS